MPPSDSKRAGYLCTNTLRKEIQGSNHCTQDTETLKQFLQCRNRHRWCLLYAVLLNASFIGTETSTGYLFIIRFICNISGDSKLPYSLVSFRKKILFRFSYTFPCESYI